MTLTLAHTGSYPRIGDSPELQVLRRAIAGFDRGERTAADLAEAENEMTRRAIEEQTAAGVELVTDGLIRWNDPVSYLAGKLAGVRVNGLLRLFDTNFYFRQPVIEARPERKRALTVDDFRFARETLPATANGHAGARSVKQVLTGPYTLARLSLAEAAEMNAIERRAMAYADALAAEIGALADAGAETVQIDEPAILLHPGDWNLFTQALARLTAARDDARKRGRKLDLLLYVYFHDCAPLYGKLITLPVDGLGLDFSYNPRLADLVAEAGSPIPLALGLVDGRNTKLERAADVAREIARLLPRIAGERAWIGPSCGLEYLPRDRAQAKLALLKEIRSAVEGR
jgi:5-methyltetrahydropteroyltriglutamate--homocysteine methyltransferase